VNTPVAPCLLIVEDDDVDFRGVKRALERERVTVPVVRAHNGEEALHHLRSALPDDDRGVIVLLDLRMPIMGGHEFLAAIRSDPKLRGLVVFVMTTSDDDRDITGAFAHQVAGYFLKRHLADYRPLMQLLQRYFSIGVVPPLAGAA
jgi:CheY-like chemotaxis protein